MIIIIFGLAAAGKTFVGNIISKHFNFFYQDADTWLNTEMQDYIKDQKHFTLDMLENFTQNIIFNIEKLQVNHKNIVISQALYRTHNRTTIKEYFASKNTEILFIQIDADDQIIFDRLNTRGDWVLPNYSASMRKFFQPMPEATIINNNQVGENFILDQLYKIPEIAKNKK